MPTDVAEKQLGCVPHALDADEVVKSHSSDAQRDPSLAEAANPLACFGRNQLSELPPAGRSQ